MIVYIATFPRSGNSLLQRMIRRGLGHLTSQVKAGFKSPETALDALRKWARDLELVHAAEPIPDWPEKVIWHERLAAYREANAPWRRMLLSLPIEALTEELRQQLALESTVFFLKKHNLPFARYFPGEYVIQSVRHPGAALWSYFRYQNDLVIPKLGHRLFKGTAPVLENIILGRLAFGSWSDYQLAWRAAAEQLGDRYLLFSFEALVANQPAALDRIAAVLKLPILRRDLIDFEEFKARFPGKDLRGTSDGYERFYSRRQLDLMWETHGEVASLYGLEPPDVSLASPDEQLRRLEALLSIAWERRAPLRETVQRLPAVSPGD